MKRIIALVMLTLLMLVAAHSITPPIDSAQAQQSAGTNYGSFSAAFAVPAISSVTATTATYTAGTLYLGGTAKAIVAGTVTGIAVSKNNCDWPAFSSCEILYWTSGTGLTHTTNINTATAAGNIPVAYVTTDSAATSTAITPATLNIPYYPAIRGEETVATTSSVVRMDSQMMIRVGSAALVGGTNTVTGLPFTSATTFVCTASGNPGTSAATGALGMAVSYTSGSTAVFTATASTSPFAYICAGH